MFHVISGRWAELWMSVSCNLWKVKRLKRFERSNGPDIVL